MLDVVSTVMNPSSFTKAGTFLGQLMVNSLVIKIVITLLGLLIY
jgi:hypothetical protein